MPKSIWAKTSFTLGEISQRCMGRFEETKPIYRDGAAMLENWLIFQYGGAFYRPGTQYIYTAGQSNPVRLESFSYSILQAYILELGNQYMRFYANGGIVLNGGNPVQISTPYLQADLFALQIANKADVAYIAHSNYPPYKLIRTSATSFTISQVNFIRGPFLDSNISATTITPSADTGIGITLTASTGIFQSGHIGALWRVKSGVVKITGFTSATIVIGDVQAEPNGTAGNLATGPGAVTDWAEGSFSAVRGYPSSVAFHENRLVFGGTVFQSQTIFGSVVGAYEDFAAGAAGASDAYQYTILSNSVLAIRWMKSTSQGLKLGTTGGCITAADASAFGITPSAPPNISIGADYVSAYLQPENIGAYIYYLQGNKFQLRQLVYDFTINADKSEDMMLLSDHILRDGFGGVQMSRQQSPNDRIWIVRSDGQLAVLTRNVEQQVFGWSRLIPGSSTGGPGRYKSVSIIPTDNNDDQVWVSVERVINGTTVQFIEMFTPELFQNDWEPNRLDASLSIDNPLSVSGATQASPGVITVTSHGLTTGDKIKIDSLVGMTELNGNIYVVTVVNANTFTLSDNMGNAINTQTYGKYLYDGKVRKMNTVFSGLNHLNGETVSVTVDGGLPAAKQTFLVSDGTITLQNPAAVIHIGLPYTGTLQFLSLGEQSGGYISQTKKRKIYKITFRLWSSMGGKFGDSLSSLYPIIYPSQTPNVVPGHFQGLFTGDLNPSFESMFQDIWNPFIVQDKPLPFMILASVFRSDIEEDK